MARKRLGRPKGSKNAVDVVVVQRSHCPKGGKAACASSRRTKCRSAKHKPAKPAISLTWRGNTLDGNRLVRQNARGPERKPLNGGLGGAECGRTVGGLEMDERQANAVAEALGGTAWNSGGGIWLVRFERSDGKLAVLSDDVVCEYADEEAFDHADAAVSIALH